MDVRPGFQVREPLGDGAFLVVHVNETWFGILGYGSECIADSGGSRPPIPI
jgi:hypothetical protein